MVIVAVISLDLILFISSSEFPRLSIKSYFKEKSYLEKITQQNGQNTSLQGLPC